MYWVSTPSRIWRMMGCVVGTDRIAVAIVYVTVFATCMKVIFTRNGMRWRWQEVRLRLWRRRVIVVSAVAVINAIFVIFIVVFAISSREAR